MQPSTYQQAIYDAAVAKPRRNLVIQARAGCGKTSTLLGILAARQAARQVPASAILVAFNRAIAAELRVRAPDWCTVKTLHAVGYAACRWLGVVVAKDQSALALNRALAALPEALRPPIDVPEVRQRELRLAAVRPHLAALRRLVGLAKNQGWSTEDSALTLSDLLDEHGIETPTPSLLCAWAAEILAATLHDPGPTIDFDDMIWLPYVRHLPAPQYDLILVDEAQDLNPPQIALLDALRGPRSQVIAVGDDRQAIYGWRGAGTGVLAELASRLDAIVLPLPRTYRCAAAIVAEAQREVPEYAGHREELGLVATASHTDLLNGARPGDYVLSRTNAPLARICLDLIRRRVSAAIAGRDVAAGLLGLCVGAPSDPLAPLLASLAERADQAAERAAAAPESDSKASAAQRALDNSDTIAALADGLAAIGDLRDRIEALFVDPSDSRSVVLCSTTHKAKGLERPRVWLLRDTYLRTHWRRSGPDETGHDYWIEIPPSQEEHNLLYVAITRAQDALYYVHGGL